MQIALDSFDENEMRTLGGVGKASAETSSLPGASCHAWSSPLRPPLERGETPHHPAAFRSMLPDLVVLMPAEQR